MDKKFCDKCKKEIKGSHYLVIVYKYDKNGGEKEEEVEDDDFYCCIWCYKNKNITLVNGWNKYWVKAKKKR